MPLRETRGAAFSLTAALVDEDAVRDRESIHAEMGDDLFIEWISAVLTVLVGQRLGAGASIDVLTGYANALRNETEEEIRKPILVDVILRAGSGDTRPLAGLSPGEYLEPLGVVIRHLYADLVRSRAISLESLFADADKLVESVNSRAKAAEASGDSGD